MQSFKWFCTCLNIVALNTVECLLQDYSTQALARKRADDFKMPLIKLVDIDSFRAPDHDLLTIKSYSPELSITAQLHGPLSVTDRHLIRGNLNGTHLSTKLGAYLKITHVKKNYKFCALNNISPVAL